MPGVVPAKPPTVYGVLVSHLVVLVGTTKWDISPKQASPLGQQRGRWDAARHRAHQSPSWFQGVTRFLNLGGLAYPQLPLIAGHYAQGTQRSLSSAGGALATFANFHKVKANSTGFPPGCFVTGLSQSASSSLSKSPLSTRPACSWSSTNGAYALNHQACLKHLEGLRKGLIPMRVAARQ